MAAGARCFALVERRLAGPAQPLGAPPGGARRDPVCSTGACWTHSLAPFVVGGRGAGRLGGVERTGQPTAGLPALSDLDFHEQLLDHGGGGVGSLSAADRSIGM